MLVMKFNFPPVQTSLESGLSGVLGHIHELAVVHTLRQTGGRIGAQDQAGHVRPLPPGGE